MMWPFAHKPADVPLSDPIRVTLSKERGVSIEGGATWRMVEDRGEYSGRPVTYFRVFDPGNAKWGNAEVRRFNDLDVGRILHSGHVESNGTIVLNRDSGQT